jgi:hypothetical protein
VQSTSTNKTTLIEKIAFEVVELNVFLAHLQARVYHFNPWTIQQAREPRARHGTDPFHRLIEANSV